jgi:hypothetical protein
MASAIDRVAGYQTCACLGTGEFIVSTRRHPAATAFQIAVCLFLLFPSPQTARAQHNHPSTFPGRGAISAQDVAKLTAPAVAGSDAADHLAGCGSQAKTDPGTPKGTYTIVVTATAGSGSSQDQASVNVPVTIQ